MGTGGPFPRGKANHSSPSSSEVKNAWNYTSTPSYIFMAWCLVKNKENFSFIFTFTSIYFWLKAGNFLTSLATTNFLRGSLIQGDSCTLTGVRLSVPVMLYFAMNPACLELFHVSQRRKSSFHSLLSVCKSNDVICALILGIVQYA
jgi:hypothetical protein